MPIFCADVPQNGIQAALGGISLVIQVNFSHGHDQDLNDPGVDDLLITGILTVEFIQYGQEQRLDLAVIIPKGVCAGVGGKEGVFEMDLIATDHRLKGAAVFESRIDKLRHKQAVDQFKLVGGGFVGVLGIVIDNKIIPLVNVRIRLIPAVDGAALQDICQFQIAVGVGLPFRCRADEYVEFVFIQVVCVIHHKYTP